ncbi:MAG: CRISPR-associated endonuclease Cas1, partial [Nanoarchaeota archaeon]
DLRYELTGGLSTLETVLKSIEGLEQDSRERLRGLEGGAAAAYFSAYTSLFPESLGFKKRERRPPPDPVNALLSLIYTLIHYEAVREIEVIGLDPTIGFYHEFDYGRESLACDLVELIRPSVDCWVWMLFRERVFTIRDFTTGGERPGCYLKKEGRKTLYLLYEEWVKDIRASLVGEVRELARNLMDGKDANIVSE